MRDWTPGLVSIVIPCYNTERFLRAAVESALAQTYPRVEVIVVDDGSTDGSRAVAESFGDRIVLVTQPNRGLSAARNAGIARSRGEYILLLDADDVLAPTCAASRVALLERDPAIGLVAGYFREIDERGALLPRIPELRRVGARDPFRQAVRRNWGPPVGWTFRREALERCGLFDPLLRACEDWDLAIRVAACYRIGYIPTVEVFYRKSEGSMSRNHRVMLREMARVQRKNRAYAPSAWRYWIDCRFGEFEHSRRVLYDSLFATAPRIAIPRTVRLIAGRPQLLWVGALAALTWLAGKRRSARSAPGSAELAPTG